MQLVIFDIDGTLTNSNAIDHQCFAQAFADVFGIVTNEAEWAACPHVSDLGLAQFLLERHYRRAPTRAEIARVHDHFINLLQTALHDAPHHVTPIDGANAAFAQIADAASPYHAAIATGCWRASAHCKLRHTALEFTGIPLGSSDEFAAREAILTDALQQAETHNATRYQRVVYVGDGLWDVHTTRKLNMPFVGIGKGERAAQLQTAGASHVIPDYTDLARFLNALQEAQVPQ